jgi:small-conductance mechanosensitive channel
MHAQPSAQPAARHAARRFTRHYAEMVLAMVLGMAALGVPLGWGLGAAGTSWSALHEDAPALMLLAMALTMTVPMVGWMRHRGHGWRAANEMSGAMLLPTAAVIGLLGAGLVEDLGTLMVIEHVAMLASMLAAMLLRPAEYTGAHGRPREHAREVTA